MSVTNSFKAVLSVLLLALTMESALAHGGATGIVKERMDAMVTMSDAMKELTAMMRGKVDYNEQRVEKLALSIAENAGDTLLEKFPEGSAGGASEAEPAIWTRWGQFETYANELSILSEGLAKAAGNAGSGAAEGGAPSMDMTTGMGMTAGMGGGMMGTGEAVQLSVESLASQPAADVFRQLAQNCTGCHTQFRKE